jgi:hypothetical protein
VRGRLAAQARAFHAPLRLATSTAARPAGAITPAADNRSTRCVFSRDQRLAGLRGVTRIVVGEMASPGSLLVPLMFTAPVEAILSGREILVIR